MNIIEETFEQGEGILRLIPNFIPRRFSKPGYRLRLHPDDYFALGTKRGAIKERWFSSVIPAMNGEMAPSDEGMSYVLPFNEKLANKFLFKNAIDFLGNTIIAKDIFDKINGWPMDSKI